MKVFAFRVVKLQRRRKSIEYLDGCAAAASLFESRVVIDTDARELGQLFPTKARHPPPVDVVEADIGWRQSGAAGPEEVGELGAVPFHDTQCVVLHPVWHGRGWPSLSRDRLGPLGRVGDGISVVVWTAPPDTTPERKANMSQLITGAPLTGRTAVVTGASSGIGEATAQRLAALGARVALIARRQDRLDELARRISSAGGAALAVPVDVTDRESVSRAAGRVAAEWGQADLVFANAGVQLISAIDDLKVDDWQRQIDLNITGVMNTIAAFVPHLIENADAGRPADLMTTSSIAATRVLEKFSVYSGTKAYLSQLTRLLRVELGQKMVRVSTIEPGMVDTELPDHVTDPDASKLMADLIENIDVLSAADVAETVAFTAALPRHVNLTEITILPTQQAI